MRRGHLDVRGLGFDGRIYRIPHCPDGVDLMERPAAAASLCVEPTRRLPAADIAPIHTLLIEGDEARDLRVANHMPAGTARRISRARAPAAGAPTGCPRITGDGHAESGPPHRSPGQGLELE